MADLDKQLLANLSELEAKLLAIVALAQPLLISHLQELVAGIGLRESPTRAHSTTTLRAALVPLLEKGLIRELNGGYRCQYRSTMPVLRWAARRPDFQQLANACGKSGREGLDVTIVSNGAGAHLELARAHADDPTYAEDVALASLSPWDGDWYETLPPTMRNRLLELALPAMEARGPDWRLYDFLVQNPSKLESINDNAWAALGGTAALRADVSMLRLLGARLEQPSWLKQQLACALAVIEGRFSDASTLAAQVPNPTRGEHAGVLLWMTTFAEALDNPQSDKTRRRVAHGGHKRSGFVYSFRIYESALAAGDGFPPQIRPVGKQVRGDLLMRLCETQRLLAMPLGELSVSSDWLTDSREHASHYDQHGVFWLAAQFRHAAACIEDRRAKHGPRYASAAPLQPPNPGEPASIFLASSARERWTIDLDRLEQSLAQLVSDDKGTPSTAGERIAWRTMGQHGYLEPYVQKRGANGTWTAGRKLALKHLMPHSPLLGSLPPEDVKVAHHILEQHSSSYGYPRVDYVLGDAAWLELIGHPRVFFQQEPQPRQVIRGQPKVSFRSEGEQSHLSLEPDGLRPGVNLRFTSGQVTVYSLEQSWKGVLDALSPSLTVPEAGKARLAALVERLALVVPVDSTEATGAKTIPAEAAGSGAGKVRIQIFAELTRLRRLCCHPELVAPGSGLTSSKLESFLELAEELIAGGHRALVFSQFTDVLALARTLLDAKNISYQYLDGSTPTKQRTAAVDAFQDGQSDIFLISLKAGGFGLNLTGADYVVHLDPWWNPAVESQASDRAHRIGQTRPVTVYRLVTTGSIEERIMALHREKRDLADALLSDTDHAARLSADELRNLLEQS